jgi:hypothetical protein
MRKSERVVTREKGEQTQAKHQVHSLKSRVENSSHFRCETLTNDVLVAWDVSRVSMDRLRRDIEKRHDIALGRMGRDDRAWHSAAEAADEREAARLILNQLARVTSLIRDVYESASGALGLDP